MHTPRCVDEAFPDVKESQFKLSRASGLILDNFEGLDGLYLSVHIAYLPGEAGLCRFLLRNHINLALSRRRSMLYVSLVQGHSRAFEDLHCCR